MLRKEWRRWWEGWRGSWTSEGVRSYKYQKALVLTLKFPGISGWEEGMGKVVSYVTRTLQYRLVAFNKRKHQLETWFVSSTHLCYLS